MKMLLTLLAIALLHTAFAEVPKRVLFIGNSYTGGIKHTLNAMLEHEGIDVEVAYLNPGGKTLAWHWENDSKERILQGDWDVVVLQDQSQTPAYPGLQESFFKASTQLADFIRAHDAKPVLYLTWGRKDGDRQNITRSPNYATMQDRLSASYERAAEQTGAMLVPCGEVWRQVRLMDPELGEKLYAKDGSHPSAHGAYLVAATFTARLFGKAPASIGYAGGLSEGERETVLRAVEGTLR
ncbi:MAG: putative cupin superfamily protein [Kiritimatiellia bacterium]|jgi:uncharacterized cupin superfamily protein